MKIKKITAVFTSAVLLCIFGNFSVSAIEKQINDTEYTIEDVKLLQDFLLAKPISTNLEGKHYELNNDGRLDVFDLCLMKQKILQDNQ